ncbi:MAG: energy transducer TonB [Deltaproteobacteria bacterium]|nr:MAG: energy transducer TonB [Deltaproteobacteria bacterium]
MPLPQQPARRGRRLTIAVVVSITGHFLLMLGVARDAIFHAPKHVVPQIVSLVTSDRSQLQGIRPGGPQTTAAAPQQQIPRLPVAPVPPPEKEEKLERGQVVSLGPTNEQAPDKATKYLSEKDSRVEKETRARETSAFYKNALSKLQKEGRTDKAEAGAPATSAHPGDNGTAGGGARQKRQREVAQLPGRERMDPLRLEEAPDGTVRNREGTDAFKGTGNRIARADPGSDGKASSIGPGSPGAEPGMPGDLRPLKLTLNEPVGATGPIAGGPMPDDLRGIEEGEGTFLNARSFKFAGFLNRVKETVGRVWTQKVIDASGKRDPTGQLYSYKDRRTVIEFTLDRQGEITDVHVAASSGVQYLDEVAVDAFRIVQRFPNPPPGLIREDGTVKLPFAFTLLAATGGMRLQVGPAYVPGSPASRGF